MKIEYEAQIMRKFYLCWALRNIQDLRLYQINQAFEISKSELQRVLPRLIKRGWIKKEKKWIGLHASYSTATNKKTGKTGLVNETALGKYFKKIKDDGKGTYESSRIGPYSYEQKRSILKNIISKHTAHEYWFYSLLSFPYLVGPNSQNVPNGTKRFWKRISREMKLVKKTLGKTYKTYPVIISVKEKMSVIKQGKVEKKKMKALGIQDGKYKLQDPSTKEITEIDESEVVRIPNKKSSIPS